MLESYKYTQCCCPCLVLQDNTGGRCAAESKNVCVTSLSDGVSVEIFNRATEERQSEGASVVKPIAVTLNPVKQRGVQKRAHITNSQPQRHDNCSGLWASSTVPILTAHKAESALAWRLDINKTGGFRVLPIGSAAAPPKRAPSSSSVRYTILAAYLCADSPAPTEKSAGSDPMMVDDDQKGLHTYSSTTRRASERNDRGN